MDGRETQLPESIEGLCRAYAEGLEHALGDKLYAVYIYGASVFPETKATGDVDAHVILKASITVEEKQAVSELHEKLASLYSPFGADLDAYFLLLEEARRSEIPTHQLQTSIVDSSWALHRAHMLAGRCVVLFGPQPTDIFPAPSWAELADALASEFGYVEAHVTQYPDYCVLNLCRLMYSYRTGDVVTSKAAAGCWASSRFPQWYFLIECANRSYARMASVEDEQMMRTKVRRFLAFARQQIAAYGFRDGSRRDASGGLH